MLGSIASGDVLQIALIGLPRRPSPSPLPHAAMHFARNGASGRVREREKEPRLESAAESTTIGELHRGVAQLGLERLVRDQEVASSNLVTPIDQARKSDHLRASLFV